MKKCRKFIKKSAKVTKIESFCENVKKSFVKKTKVLSKT